MSLNTITSAQLLPAAIVAIGADAAEVGVHVDGYYPSVFTKVDSLTPQEATALATAVLADLDERGAAAQGSSGLPAIAVLASTDQSAQVADLVRALREQTSTLRPRVWPTFVTGETGLLAGFDERLDELGTGACDLVLMMNGDAGASAKAGALGAWLHVKMPAPPSVLGELPDVTGSICRYVAIGSAAVTPMADPVADPDATDTSVDADAVAAAVEAALVSVANKTVNVTAANDAASALCAAAEDLDAGALLRAETHLAQALSDISRQLAKHLTDALPKIVEAELDAGPAALASDIAAGSDTDAAQTATAPADDRTEAVSQLVLLASKGGLTKMFSRSRMTGIAQSVSAAARRDVADAVQQAIAPVSHEVSSQVAAGIQRRAAVAQAHREAQVAQVTQAAEEAWRLALANCRESVALWPRVETSGVRRSWGGSAPSPRQYVVGSEAALRGLPDDDDALSVIDLREAVQASADSVASIDLRDGTRGSQERHATVLVAQYGLPLSAFPA